MPPVQVPPIFVDFSILDASADLDDFIQPGDELLARCGMVSEQLIDAVDLATDAGRSLNADEAVIGGLLVRMTKLCRAIFDSSRSEQSEAHLPLTRAAAETAITLRWFVKQDDPLSYKRFRADSFAFFRDSDPYEGDVPKDDPEAAEQKQCAELYRAEIDRRLTASGVTWQDVPKRDQSWGPNLRQRFEALGEDGYYEVLFKSHSAYVHPSWHEMQALHLADAEGSDGGFVLAYTYASMMPIAAYVLSRLMLEAVLDAATMLPNDLDAASLRAVVERSVELIYELSLAFHDFSRRVGFDPEFMA